MGPEIVMDVRHRFQRADPRLEFGNWWPKVPQGFRLLRRAASSAGWVGFFESSPAMAAVSSRPRDVTVRRGGRDSTQRKW